MRENLKQKSFIQKVEANFFRISDIKEKSLKMDRNRRNRPLKKDNSFLEEDIIKSLHVSLLYVKIQVYMQDFLI